MSACLLCQIKKIVLVWVNGQSRRDFHCIRVYVNTIHKSFRSISRMVEWFCLSVLHSMGIFPTAHRETTLKKKKFGRRLFRNSSSVKKIMSLYIFLTNFIHQRSSSGYCHPAIIVQKAKRHIYKMKFCLSQNTTYLYWSESRERTCSPASILSRNFGNWKHFMCFVFRLLCSNSFFSVKTTSKFDDQTRWTISRSECSRMGGNFTRPCTLAAATASMVVACAEMGIIKKKKIDFLFNKTVKKNEIWRRMKMCPRLFAIIMVILITMITFSGRADYKSWNFIFSFVSGTL